MGHFMHKVYQTKQGWQTDVRTQMDFPESALWVVKVLPDGACGGWEGTDHAPEIRLRDVDLQRRYLRVKWPKGRRWGFLFCFLFMVQRCELDLYNRARESESTSARERKGKVSFGRDTTHSSVGFVCIWWTINSFKHRNTPLSLAPFCSVSWAEWLIVHTSLQRQHSAPCITWWSDASWRFG